jgi:hypothetical protein
VRIRRQLPQKKDAEKNQEELIVTSERSFFPDRDFSMAVSETHHRSHLRALQAHWKLRLVIIPY